MHIPNTLKHSPNTRFQLCYCKKPLLISFSRQSLQMSLVHLICPSSYAVAKNSRRIRKSSPRIWTTAKSVFRTPRKTYRKSIKCSGHWVPLLYASKKVKKISGWEDEAEHCQCRACQQVRKTFLSFQAQGKKAGLPNAFHDFFTVMPWKLKLSFALKEKDIKGLLQVRIKYIAVWTSHSEAVRSYGIPLRADTLLWALAPCSVESQGGCFTYFMKGTGIIVFSPFSH